MRKSLVIGATALSAVALLAMAAGDVAAETTGSVGVSLTTNDYASGYGYESYELEAAIFHRIDGPWAVQAEGRVETVEYGASGDDGHHLALHGLFATDTYTLGLIVGQGELFSGRELDFYGVEGAYRFANWTLSGSAVLGDSNYYSYFDRYRVGAKYFIADNFAIGGGYALSDFGFEDTDTWEIGAEVRFLSVPITLSGGYLRQEGNSIEVDAWQIATRWTFGTSNLREDDRTAPIAAIDTYFGDRRRSDP